MLPTGMLRPVVGRHAVRSYVRRHNDGRVVQASAAAHQVLKGGHGKGHKGRALHQGDSSAASSAASDAVLAPAVAEAEEAEEAAAAAPGPAVTQGSGSTGSAAGRQQAALPGVAAQTAASQDAILPALQLGDACAVRAHSIGTDGAPTGTCQL